MFLFGIFLSSTVFAGEIVIGGTDYWTPYCYSTQKDTNDLKGYTVEIVKKILGSGKNDLVFRALPWKRCLWMLEHNQIDIVLDSSMNLSRLEKFVFSDPAYSVDNVFFYSKRKFPAGLEIDSVHDVDNYSLGGIAGFNYSIYPFNATRSEKGALDYRVMMAMLKHDRYDLGLGLKQVVLSYAQMNDLDMDDIGWLPMPEFPALSFYIIANKNPRGKKMIRDINQGLKDMKESGALEILKTEFGIN